MGDNENPTADLNEGEQQAAQSGDIGHILASLNDAVLRLERKVDARPTVVAGSEKPLKSVRLNVQHQLNADWIARICSRPSILEDPVLEAVVDDMKARNTLLRKGDVAPEFFPFYENYHEAKPELSLGQAVPEALLKFNELDAARPRSASSYMGGPIRKRPFRNSGGSGGRAGAAYPRESGNVQQLSQQIAFLQQQVNGGYGSTPYQPRHPKPASAPQCFNCKGYGHYSKQCSQGPLPRQ